MKLQATVSKSELHALVAQLVPFELDLDGNGNSSGGVLGFDQLTALELVPEQGLRLTLTGKVTWPVLGIDVPVGIKSVRVLVRLNHEARPTAQLVVRLTVEEADLAWVPGAVDRSIAERINSELTERHFELAWDFEKLLSHRFAMPEALLTTRALALLVDSSAFRVTSGELRLDVTLHAAAHSA